MLDLLVPLLMGGLGPFELDAHVLGVAAPWHATVDADSSGDCACGRDYRQYGVAAGLELSFIDAIFVSVWGAYAVGTVDETGVRVAGLELELGVDVGNQRDLLVQLRWKPAFTSWMVRSEQGSEHSELLVAWYGHGEIRVGRPRGWHILGVNARPTLRDHRLVWLGWGWTGPLSGEAGLAVPGALIEPSGDPLPGLPVALYGRLAVPLASRVSLELQLVLGGVVAATIGLGVHLGD